MPSDDTTVATQADFVPMAVGNTDRVRSVVSVSAHDGFSHQPRSGMQQGRLSVLEQLVSLLQLRDSLLRHNLHCLYSGNYELAWGHPCLSMSSCGSIL